MANIKISASYWNGLHDWQREFLQMYAYTHGIRYCKRILSMAGKFSGVSLIVNASAYCEEGAKMAVNNWLIFAGEKLVGMVAKYDSIGISERIYVKESNGFTEVWNNWPKSAKKSLQGVYSEALNSLYK